MTQFLDMRSSSNSTSSGTLGIELAPQPELFGVIGLAVSSLPNTIITLSGTVGLIGEEGDTFTIQIVRGAAFNATDVIYRADGTISTTGSNEIHSFHAQDLSAPTIPQVIYTSYISGVSTTVRDGPEVFFGIASTS